jgi:hypothetical protein
VRDLPHGLVQLDRVITFLHLHDFDKYRSLQKRKKIALS